MNLYSCEPCMKFFNGIRPYESHLASAKHKKKINESPPVVQDFSNCNFNVSNWEKEPFIVCLEKDFKCTLCNAFLNSMDQVRCHINGAKHLKEKARNSLSPNSNVLFPNLSTDQTDSYSSTSDDDSRFQFYLHTVEAKDLLEDMNVFKPDDDIVFNTV